MLQHGEDGDPVKGAVRKLEVVLEMKPLHFEIRRGPAGRGVVVQPDAVAQVRLHRLQEQRLVAAAEIHELRPRPDETPDDARAPAADDQIEGVEILGPHARVDRLRPTGNAGCA